MLAPLGDPVGERVTETVGKAGRLAALLGVLVASSCSTHQPYLDYALTKGLILPAPPDDQAQVVIVPAVHEGTELALYEDGRFLLPLHHYTCHVRRIEPGEHRFGIVGDKNAEFAQGTLHGGATYLLLAYQTFAGRYSLKPMLPATRHTSLTMAHWIEVCLRVDANEETHEWRAEREPTLENRRQRHLKRWETLPASQQSRITWKHALRQDLAFVAR